MTWWRISPLFKWSQRVVFLQSGLTVDWGEHSVGHLLNHTATHWTSVALEIWIAHHFVLIKWQLKINRPSRGGFNYLILTAEVCSLVRDYKWTVLNLKCGSPSRWTAVTRLQHSSARDGRVAASAGRSLELQHRLQHRNILFYLTHAVCVPHQTWATRILNHIRVLRQKIVDSNIYSLICAGALLWQIRTGLFWLVGCIHANIRGSIREWLEESSTHNHH